MTDPEELYDPNAGSDPKPKTSPPKKDFFSSVEGPDQSFASASSTNTQEYLPYMDEGVYDSKGDLNQLRGYRQSGWAKVGIRLANLVPNIASQALGMIGYTGALATEWGDDRDYSNAFTQAADAIKDPFGQTYRRSNDVFALSDPTWWIDNIANLAEVAVPFAGEAALAGGLMEKVAMGAAGLFRAGSTGTRIARGAGQLATAGFTAYTEAAMDGAQVYQQTYDTQLRKLLAKGTHPDEAKEEAKHIAAESASTTVQLSTAMTTLLNLSSVAPFFKKSEDVVNDVLRTQMRRDVGESIADWSKRIKSLAPEQFANKIFDHHGLKSYLGEALQEGGEEMEQYFAQKTGQDEGEKGTTHGFLEQFGQLEHLFDRTMDAQGALSGVLGAFGGVAQTALIHSIIPSKFSNVDEKGNLRPQVINSDGTLKFNNGQPVYETKLVTPRTYDEWNVKSKFNSVRDSLAKDISNFGDMQTQYVAAVKAGDTVTADSIRKEMFNVASVNAVTTGMAEPWRNTFDQIANYDNQSSLDSAVDDGPTEAMQKGYATDRNDNDYKKKAQDSISDLDKYEEEYNKLAKRYGSQIEANQGTKDLVDMMFNRKVAIMEGEKLLQHHEAELKKLTDDEDGILHTANPEDFDHAMVNYQRTAPALQRVRDKLVEDHTILSNAIVSIKAGDTTSLKEVQRLVKKYRAKGINDKDLSSAVTDLSEKLSREIDKKNEAITQANDLILNSSGFTGWLEKNPGKSFEEYKAQVAKKYQMSQSNDAYRTNIENFRAQHTVAAKNYADLYGEKSVQTWARKMEEWHKDLVEAKLEAETARKVKMEEVKASKATGDRLKKLEAQQYADQYKEQYEGTLKDIEREEKQLAEVNKQLESVNKIKDYLKYRALKNQAADLKKQLIRLQAKAKQLASLYADFSVDTSTPPPGDVQDDNNGLNTEVSEEVIPPVVDDETIIPEGSTSIVVVPQTEITPEQTQTEVVNEEDDVELFGNRITPASQYMEQLQDKPTEVLAALSNIEDGLRNGTLKFSLDLLKPQVKAKLIGQSKAALMLDLLRQMLEDEKGEDTGTAPAPLPVTVESPVDVDGPGTPDTPVIDGDEENSTTIAVNDLVHVGRKISDLLSVANMTHEYVEGINRAKGQYFNVGLTGKINTNLHPGILVPGQLGEGTPIRFELDRDWKGGLNYDTQMKENDDGTRAQREDEFANYIGTNGKVKKDNIANVPIKIVEVATGKTVGYVRRADWATAKFEGTADNSFKNFAAEQEGGTDALKKQVELLKQTREAIVQKLENGQVVQGKTTSKGVGVPVLNYEVNLNGDKKGKVKMGFARGKDEKNSLLPGKTIIGIVNNGQVLVNRLTPFSGPKAFNDLELNNGRVVALLPGANGQYFASELPGRKLSDLPTALNSVVRAVELYLLWDGTPNEENDKAVAQIFKATGFNLHDPDAPHIALQNFIKQYFTHLNPNFQEKHTSPVYKKGEANRQEEFMLNIWNGTLEGEPKARIMAGRTFAGIFSMANLVNGKLNPEFVAILAEGFKERSRAVNFTHKSIRGINSEDFSGADIPFTEIVADKNGKWTPHTYPSYNEFVKSWSRTAIYGRNKVGDTYVYTANPQLPFEVDIPKGTEKVEVKQNTSTTQVKLPGSSDTKAAVKPAPVTVNENTPWDFHRDNVKVGDSFEVKYNWADEYVRETVFAKERTGRAWLVGETKEKARWRNFKDYRGDDLRHVQSTPADKAPPVPPPTPAVDTSISDDLADLMDASLHFSDVDEIGTPPAEARPLTVQNLDTIYKGTPERNGKTVQEVYDELHKRGHTFIADGFNPFSKCL